LGSFNFDEQYNTFHQYGYAAEPSGQGFVGDFERMKQHEGEFVQVNLNPLFDRLQA
jgi:pre-mRNA-processing factor 17